MLAIRWLSGGMCEFCETEDFGETGPSVMQSAVWEKNPNREVSVEITPSLKNCFGTGVGLLLDSTESTLVRVYPEDGWTMLMEDGFSVRSEREDRTDDCRTDFGTCWEDCEKMYNSVIDRDGWCEGIINSPKYTHIVVKDTLNEELINALHTVFGLPTLVV